MLFGFKPFSTKYLKMFTRVKKFVVFKFIKEGKELLKYVSWFNRTETEKPLLFS